MQKFKDFVLEWDFFNHSTLHRYKERECYRTLTGGVISMLLVSFFVVMFANMTIDTFQNNIITSKISVNYDDNPASTTLHSSPSQNFMFAIGLSGIDLASPQRYFDFSLQQYEAVTSGSSRTKHSQRIPLQPCTQAHWNAASVSMTQNFNVLGFNKWLCPPIGTKLNLEGKYTSSMFQYAQIKVSKCTQNNTYFPGTTCKNQSQISSFLGSSGEFKLRFYFINPVINGDEKEYLKYYLEDRNYFSFDMQIGVLGNLFFNDWKVSSDQSIFPWKKNKDVSGLKTVETAVDHNYVIDSSNTYFKFYLRKSASSYHITRSHQKLDQTFAYIGGLFGTIILLLSFLKLYSKYCYQLQLGDRIFKQDNNGSFGSENFNFLVFFGYVAFNILTKFNTFLEWKVMKKYHQCRSECQKQLNISLLFKKMAHLEESIRIFMEEHQQNTLLLMPKPTLQEIKRNRERFYVKSLLYKTIQEKGREVQIQQEDISQFRNKIYQYFKRKNCFSEANMEEIPQKEQSLRQRLKKSVVSSYIQIDRECEEQNEMSQKILSRLNSQELTKNVFIFIHDEKQDNINRGKFQNIKEGSEIQSKQQSSMSAKPFASHFDFSQGNQLAPSNSMLVIENRQKLALKTVKVSPLS